ncbi:hypothetical protein DEO72_LG11g3270 [Vigna unguiculata]|uniref:Uncharacterized protein n=1 Tax=Vigna unguiculata TaxID=3917 RepID=A0A4D6NWK7_VIGUN|nr:hypothetical protein DEO72_LG11g3270 [Vigna unguiculata]
MEEHSNFKGWRICSASRVVAKLIYIVGHISLSTEAKFLMTIETQQSSPLALTKSSARVCPKVPFTQAQTQFPLHNRTNPLFSSTVTLFCRSASSARKLPCSEVPCRGSVNPFPVVLVCDCVGFYLYALKSFDVGMRTLCMMVWFVFMAVAAKNSGETC